MAMVAKKGKGTSESREAVGFSIGNAYMTGREGKKKDKKKKNNRETKCEPTVSNGKRGSVIYVFLPSGE